MLNYGKQHISDNDIAAVVQVLKSPYLTQGPVVPLFEQAICQLTQAQFGIAVNSATSALHIACLSLGLQQGDSVWTSPISFVASANCALYCGASIDFIDIDPQTCNLSIPLLTHKLAQAKKTNCLPKIIIAVHLAGHSCDMQALHQLSKKYHFHIIEDAAHALGGYYRNKPIGNGEFSTISVFSFHPVKSITSGEGGMAVCNDKKLADKMALLRNHGITRDIRLITSQQQNACYYEQLNLGFNYRMSDLHAALGLSQLQQLKHFIKQREKIVAYYNEQLSTLPITLPRNHPDNHSSHHLYIIRLHRQHNQKNIIQQCHAQGIGVNIHYIPIHLQPYYQRLGFKHGDFPNAENYYQKAITLPLYPTLSRDEQDTIINTLKTLLK